MEYILLLLSYMKHIILYVNILYKSFSSLFTFFRTSFSRINGIARGAHQNTINITGFRAGAHEWKIGIKQANRINYDYI